MCDSQTCLNLLDKQTDFDILYLPVSHLKGQNNTSCTTSCLRHVKRRLFRRSLHFSCFWRTRRIVRCVSRHTSASRHVTEHHVTSPHVSRSCVAKSRSCVSAHVNGVEHRCLYHNKHPGSVNVLAHFRSATHARKSLVVLMECNVLAPRLAYADLNHKLAWFPPVPAGARVPGSLPVRTAPRGERCTCFAAAAVGTTLTGWIRNFT